MSSFSKKMLKTVSCHKLVVDILQCSVLYFYYHEGVWEVKSTNKEDSLSSVMMACFVSFYSFALSL